MAKKNFLDEGSDFKIINGEALASDFAKIGIYGFTKGGKSYLAALLAAGLHKYLGLKKPIMWVDTEQRVRAVYKQIFKPAGIELRVVKTRNLKVLGKSYRYALKECSIHVVDQISHVWKDTSDAYKKSKKRDSIRVWDWGIIKPMWFDNFNDPYLLSELHCIWIGRAKSVFEESEDDEGREKIVKTGTEAATEKDTGYEAYLLIEMLRILNREYQKDPKKHNKYLREASIVGDNYGALDGKVFQNAQFKDFIPHFEALGLSEGNAPVGGGMREVQKADSKMFEGNKVAAMERYRVKKALEEIQNHFEMIFPGCSRKGSLGRSLILETMKMLSGFTAWAEWQNMHPDQLEFYKTVLQEMLKIKKNKFEDVEIHTGEWLKEVQYVVEQLRNVKDGSAAVVEAPGTPGNDEPLPWEETAQKNENGAGNSTNEAEERKAASVAPAQTTNLFD